MARIQWPALRLGTACTHATLEIFCVQGGVAYLHKGFVLSRPFSVLEPLELPNHFKPEYMSLF